MKTPLPLLVCIGFLFAATTGSAADSSTVFFPRRVLFPRILGDGTSQQMSVNKDFHSRQWLGSIGGLQRVIQFSVSGLTVQVGVGASVKATLIKMPAVVQVVTVDFFVDFPLEVQLTQSLFLKTGWGHFSGHFADDGLELLGLASVNYAKDYSPLLLACAIPELGGFVYGGARIDYYTIPEYGKNWMLQCGAEAGNFLIGSGVRAYGTIDIKARAEVAWGTTQSYQVGIKMLERDLQAVRIAYTYRTGIADQGQFYKRRVEMRLMGVYFDF